MTILVVSCEPKKDGASFDEKEKQTTESVGSTASSEDETTNTTDTTDTTGSGDTDNWTGIY
jgi:hypothetical protein